MVSVMGASTLADYAWPRSDVAVRWGGIANVRLETATIKLSGEAIQFVSSLGNRRDERPKVVLSEHVCQLRIRTLSRFRLVRSW